MVYFIPNFLIDEINKALDDALLDHPEAVPEREGFFEQMLEYVNKYGVIPEFSVEKKTDEHKLN